MGFQRSLVTALPLLLVCGAAAQQPPLQQVGTVALPGVAGRIDHLAIDLDDQRLLVAALGNNTIEAVDARSLSASLKRLARIPTVAGARTSLFVPDQDRLYLAVPARGGHAAEIRVFDMRD